MTGKTPHAHRGPASAAPQSRDRLAIWPIDAFEQKGLVGTYGGRSFCLTCGGRVTSVRDDEADVMIGSLDEAPTDLTPQYELWIGRRENWSFPFLGRRSSRVIGILPRIRCPASPCQNQVGSLVRARRRAVEAS